MRAVRLRSKQDTPRSDELLPLVHNDGNCSNVVYE